MPDLSQVRELKPSEVEGQLILKTYQGPWDYSFSRYDTRQSKITSNYVADLGGTKLEGTFKCREGLYLHRDENGPFGIQALWRFIDMDRKKEYVINTGKYSLSDPYFRNDSVFIMCSKEDFSSWNWRVELDSLRTAYLTYLDSENRSYHFIDSVEYPLNQRFGNLTFDEQENMWRITQDSLRFHFKNSRLQKQEVDTRLLATQFDQFNPRYIRERRNTYFRVGRHRTLKHSHESILYHFWYRESDTLFYEVPFEGPLFNTELYNIQTRGFLGSLKPREDGIMDWMRYFPNNEIQMHRIEPNGGPHHIEYFPQYQYPGYIIFSMWSMPDGSFYLAGGGKRTNFQMQALLIKVDSNGVHDPELGDNIFQVSYNPEQDWLDLFIDDRDLLLWYEIWDIQGIMLHQGPVKSFEAIKLFRGSKGLHFVKLFSRDRQKYYGRRMFIRY